MSQSSNNKNEKPTVLLVLDDPSLLHRLTVGLEEAGCEVVIGATSFAARAKLERHDFDAIVASWTVDDRGPGEVIYEWVLAHKFALSSYFVFIGDERTARFDELVTDRTPLLPSHDIAAAVAKIASVAETKERNRAGPAIILEPDENPPLLLVESDEGQRRFMRDLLADVGFAVTATDSAEDAVEKLSAKEFSVVLATWEAPDGDVRFLYDWIDAERPAMFDRAVFMTGGSLPLMRLAAEKATCVAKGQDSKALLGLLVAAVRLD